METVMNYVINGYEPGRVFEIFEELCAIPHGSGNEKGIADYIEKFANNRNLFVLRDETGNVFLRKNATEGYENTAPVMLQGHMDMVCEKNADSKHDFLRDGLTLKVVDGMLWADGTTLGADNGIAVAMMLALLETNEHPTLECLFTVEEETGLAGAKGFDCSCVTAKKMINLDSEEEWQVTAGCAGGSRTEVDIAYKAENIPAEYDAFGGKFDFGGNRIDCVDNVVVARKVKLVRYLRSKENLFRYNFYCGRNGSGAL